jgi:hypothetical protein
MPKFSSDGSWRPQGADGYRKSEEENDFGNAADSFLFTLPAANHAV